MTRTSATLFWFGLAIAASVALYHTCNRVQEMNQRLQTLDASIASERESLHVLKAEWVYLANPARVEAAAHKHLALRPTSPQQVARIDELPEILPTRHEAMATVAVNATPIANVHSSLAVPPVHVATVVKKHKPSAAVASADDGHINTHMNIQRTASAQPLPDSIGALINELDVRQ